MKVAARSSTALVIRDSSALMRIMGAFFVLFGALFVGIASQGAVSLWEHTVPAIVGVPESVPALDRVRPGGSVPATFLNAPAGTPVLEVRTCV